jgi:hypothetical protein
VRNAGETPIKRPLDVTVFGVLFMLSAPAELYNIISTGWQYTPKFFGITTHGILAKGVLAAQPVLHLALGYGFLTLRRWAVTLGLFYTADVLTSAVAGFILYGYGRIRTIFIILLVPFLIYLIARRARFKR